MGGVKRWMGPGARSHRVTKRGARESSPQGAATASRRDRPVRRPVPGTCSQRGLWCRPEHYLREGRTGLLRHLVNLSWKNAELRRAIYRTPPGLRALGKIGRLPVADIDTGLVLKCIEPIWATKTETASRVRGRIESVLDWCAVRNYRKGDNPARWEGHLDNVLPARGDIQAVAHHSGAGFMPKYQFLWDALCGSARASRQGRWEFLVLCAARTSAATGATRDEVDLEQKVWSVPPDRAETKISGDQPRRIPLCDRAVEILKALPQEDDNPYLFIGGKAGTGLSNMAMAELMKEMAFPSTTPGRLAVPHGCRSSFRDWVSECTNCPNHVAEVGAMARCGRQGRSSLSPRRSVRQAPSVDE